MKFLHLIFFTLIITSIIAVKLKVTDQKAKLNKISQEIKDIDKEIEAITTDMTHITRPQKLKAINEKEFKFSPIEQEQLIILK